MGRATGLARRSRPLTRSAGVEQVAVGEEGDDAPLGAGSGTCTTSRRRPPRRWSLRRRRRRRAYVATTAVRRSPATCSRPVAPGVGGAPTGRVDDDRRVDGRSRRRRHGRPGCDWRRPAAGRRRRRGRGASRVPNGLNMKSVAISSSLPHAARLPRLRRWSPGDERAGPEDVVDGAVEARRCALTDPERVRCRAGLDEQERPSGRRGRGWRRRRSRPGRRRSRRRRDRLAVPHLRVRLLVPAAFQLVVGLGGEPDVGLDLHDRRERAVGRAGLLGDDPELAPAWPSCCRGCPGGPAAVTKRSQS